MSLSTTSTRVDPTADVVPAGTELTSAREGGTAFGAAVRRPLSIIGGVAMLVTPLLIVAGEVTSPPQASRAQADYIESLARDPWLTSVSASTLHYGWVTMAIGLIIAITLIRSKRGRVLALIGGIGGAFTAIQMSALMMNDYFLSALGNNLSMPDAVKVADAMMVHGDALAGFWWQCATLSLIFPVFLYLGMARAKIISWWVAPLSLFPMIAPFVAMGFFSNGALITNSPVAILVGAVVGLICYLPTFLVGLRLLEQVRKITD